MECLPVFLGILIPDLSLFSKSNKNKGNSQTITKPNQPSFTERLSALRNLPQFFKLVWQTSPSLTLANIFLRVVKSALPVAILYVGKLIIDQVVLLTRDHAVTNSHERLWQLVGLELGLAVLSDGLSRAIALVDS